MWQQKLRSLLAMFCIAVGTLTVVLLLALGTGFHDASYRNMLDITDGTFFIMVNKTTKSYNGFPQGQEIYRRFLANSVVNLPKVVPAVKFVSPSSMTTTFVTYKKKQFHKTIYGVAPDFSILRKIKIADFGRFFNSIDLEKNNRVVVLGNKLKEGLFGAGDTALGKEVLINGAGFKVIGVMKKETESSQNYYDDNVIIPYTNFISLFGDRPVNFFILMPDPEADATLTEQALRSYFAGIYHFDKNDKEAMKFFNTTEVFQFVRWFFVAIQIFLGLCGTMTLGVGSIGVANIMFLIVTERTREIGLRKAIGASNWNILCQLLLEALIIVMFGGGFGFMGAYFITTVLQHLHLPDWLGNPTISGATTIATIIILASVGLAAGYFPARRAAKMDPVEALAL